MKLQPRATNGGGNLVSIWDRHHVGSTPLRTLQNARHRALETGNRFFVWTMTSLGVTIALPFGTVEEVPRVLIWVRQELQRLNLATGMSIVVMDGPFERKLNEAIDSNMSLIEECLSLEVSP